jgi:hypothetical protein
VKDEVANFEWGDGLLHAALPFQAWGKYGGLFGHFWTYEKKKSEKKNLVLKPG